MQVSKGRSDEQGHNEETNLGTPQEGNLSPLLSNIMLNDLDKELEVRGLRFTRYADDSIIVVKSQSSAKRVMQSIVRWIERKPEIFNSDQGSQFTSKEFTGKLKESGIEISMDSRGRAFDNIFIERFWRNVKYE